jgi:von Willebrand factor type A domain
MSVRCGAVALLVAVLATPALAQTSPYAQELQQLGSQPSRPWEADPEGLDLPVLQPVYVAPKIDAGFTPDTSGRRDPAPNPTSDPVDEEPPPLFFGEEIVTLGQRLVFVIDRSRSMYRKVQPFEDDAGQIVVDGNRFDRARSELRRSIASLPENVEFNVVFYGTCVVSCWPSARPADAEAKAEAFAYIAGIKPDGWTNTGAAVGAALSDGADSVVLLSDGVPNYIDCLSNLEITPQQHRAFIQQENGEGATINAFGIGVQSNQDARDFMQGVAADSGGYYIEVQ